MNIVVIVIDTLRYDYIAAHGNPDIRTPNLDRLAAAGWDFHNSYTASFATIPHRTDAMTGRYGAPFFPWMPLRHDLPTLPWTLAEAGYCTQLIHDTPHLVNGGHNFDWPFHAWTFIHGAEVDRPWIDDSSEWLSNWAPDPLFDCVTLDPMAHRMVATYARANRKRQGHADWNCARLFDTAADFLRDNASRDNFFLWIDCFDPHEPWDAPPEFMRMADGTPGYSGTVDPRRFLAHWDVALSEAGIQRIKAGYAAKVMWVDHCLGTFLRALEETGLDTNTALLLTADHGTRLHEYGSFGKGAPLREQETHTPFIVRVPGDSGGESGIIVQPQDIFATVAGIAGAGVPEGVESFDVLSAARASSDGSRDIALGGRNAGPQWDAPDSDWLFTVMDGKWFLEAARRPEGSRLQRIGGTEDVAADHPDVVADLRCRGIDELQRRGADPELMQWVRSRGSGEFPGNCRLWDGYPGPAAFRPYFTRIYTDPQT